MDYEIDMSECVIEIDDSSTYTYRDKAIELVVNYVNTTTDFNIERKNWINNG